MLAPMQDLFASMLCGRRDEVQRGAGHALIDRRVHVWQRLAEVVARA
jgi:hypothetical protein